MPFDQWIVKVDLLQNPRLICVELGILYRSVENAEI